MSTEQEPLHPESDVAFDDSKASRVEVGMSELPAEVQDQELDGGDKQEEEGCVVVEPVAGETGMNKEKESVNGGSDLVFGTTKENEKKEVSVNVEKDSGGEIQTELLAEKEEEPVTKAENLDDIDCFMGLGPYESKDESPSDNDVTLKVKLSESDLVWAKVRSHPWWPGQVFDASAATDKAKKHFKKGSFLVTYFGDCSFAWNDASKIKPFRQHFSQMAKQSSLPGFLDAVDFALEEASRRIEFGLACSCISEEVYERIKTQKVINPGIREDSSRVQGGDKVSSAVFFEPAKLVEYVKRLACSPSYYDASSSDELQFVSQRAKLLAFNRWKGYADLPEFETLQGSVESAPKISQQKESAPPEPKKSKQVYTKRRKTEDKDGVFEYKDTTNVPKKKEKGIDPVQETKLSEVKESDLEPKKSKQVCTKRRKTEDKDGVFEYEDTTTTVPKKKEKTLAEFIAEKRLSKSNEKKRSHEKSDGEKKRKVVHSEPPKSAKKTKANLLTEDSGSPVSPKNDQKVTPKKAKTSFGIGASILRVANQMHCSTPTGLAPCSKNNSSKKSLQDRGKPEALSETPNGKADPIGTDKLRSGEVEHVGKETPSTDVMLEGGDLKGSSEEKMVNEEAANIVGEMTAEEDSKLTEEKITGSDLKVKEQHVNNNCPDGSSAEQ